MMEDGNAAAPLREVRFELLGPLCVMQDGRRIQLRAYRQRVILASLLLNPNRVVGADHLVDAVWGDQPPATARSQLHICVSAIRGVLREFGADDLISTEPTGYLISAQAEQLDHLQFGQLLVAAAGSAGQGRVAEAVQHQRQALGLWRGPALSGLQGSALTARATRLEEDRIVAQETCTDWELQLGRHRELISELTERVAAYPLRERNRAQLMLALHRAGRPAEALQAYRQGRAELVEQLGLEPGQELRRAEAMILADADFDSDFDATGTPAVPALPPAAEPWEPAPQARVAIPRQLPSDTADFVGRDEAVRRLMTLFDRPATRAEAAVPVVAVAGAGGIGKSTLAVHVAHLLAEQRFGDGQLYTRFTGARPEQQEVGEVLGRFLRALGVARSAIPDGIDERAELYRDLLADRQVLVLLEDVGVAAQVRPLLPGSPSCGVLITSRTRLVGLAGVTVLDLEAFHERQAAQLLSKIVGAERVAGERDEVGELTRLVDGSPLGLRIIGSRLSARPHWSLRRMTARLTESRHRLDELDLGDLDVRSTIAASYAAVPERAGLLLRLLCEFSADSFPDWIATALLDLHLFDGLELLENLVDAHLVTAAGDGPGTPSRYRIPQLVRLFVCERAAGELAELRVPALTRISGGWLSLAEQAHLRLCGSPSMLLHGPALRWSGGNELPDDPACWLRQERANLRLALRQCIAAGLDELSWDLSLTLLDLSEGSPEAEELDTLRHEVLPAARRAGNRRAEAAVLCALGSVHADRGEYEPAAVLLAQALRTFTERRDAAGRGLALHHLGTMHLHAGEFERARTRYQQALAEFQSRDNLAGVAQTLLHLVELDVRSGRPDGAISQCHAVLRLAHQGGHRRIEIRALSRLGTAQVAAGRPAEALHTLRKALGDATDAGDPAARVHALHSLGVAHHALSQLDNAAHCLQEALALAHPLTDRSVRDRLRASLSSVRAELVQSHQAAELHQRDADSA